MNTPDSAEDQSFRDLESAIMEIQGRLQFKLITRIYFGCDSEQPEVRKRLMMDPWIVKRGQKEFWKILLFCFKY